jgi:DNA-binding MarR family transcriptional regulator
MRVIPAKTRGFVRDQCWCLHVQRAARVLARRFDEALRPVGLNNGQFSLLMALSQPEPTSIGAIATLLSMDRTTLTANLKPLERRQLVTVAIDPKDRRGRLLGLTPLGLAALRAALPIWVRTHEQVEQQLAAVSADLRRALRALH